MGHQKAAFEVLTQLFTPQTVMQTPVGRVALMWFSRFDVFIGIMGCFGTTMPPQWYSAPVEYYDAKVAAEPQNVGWKIEACQARLRQTTMEMALLYAKGAKQEITEDEYTASYRRLSEALLDWKESWDPALTDPAFIVSESPEIQSPETDDVANPSTPTVLFRPPLFASTILMCEYHSIVLMHGSQAAVELTGEMRKKLTEHAYSVCKILEMVELWQDSPPGSLIILQSCLGIAALYVPREARRYMWIRRKFALLERMG
jgi:hypothetical protein